jgi:hypothetical protein
MAGTVVGAAVTVTPALATAVGAAAVVAGTSVGVAVVVAGTAVGAAVAGAKA